MHSFWTGYKFCFFVSYATITIVSKNGTIICDAWLHASMKPVILVYSQFKIWILLISSASRVLFSSWVLFGLMAKCLKMLCRLSYKFLASSWVLLTEVLVLLMVPDARWEEHFDRFSIYPQYSSPTNNFSMTSFWEAAELKFIHVAML